MIFLTPTQLSIFTAAILGHFVGDYTFQNQWMAIGKSQPGMKGTIACTAHVLAYTFAIFLLTGWNPLFLLAVAVPHWIIDRWSLATFVLKWKNGYGAWDVWKKTPFDAAKYDDPPTSDYADHLISKVMIEDIANNNDALQLNVWKVSFAAPVYIFNDNVLHWLCLYFTVMYFFK